MDNWLPTLEAPGPKEGFELALKLSRRGVADTQTSPEIRARLRASYEQDTAQLIHISHVVAVHFQTIAAANEWWRKPKS